METNWWGSAQWFLWMKDQSRGSGLFGWSWILHEEKGGCCFEWRKGEWGEDVVFRRESGWCWLTCSLSCHCGLEVDLGVCLCWDQPMLMRGEIMLCVCVCVCVCVCECAWVGVGVCVGMSMCVPCVQYILCMHVWTLEHVVSESQCLTFMLPVNVAWGYCLLKMCCWAWNSARSAQRVTEAVCFQFLPDTNHGSC